MSKNRKTSTGGAMLDLWRPPQEPGDPVGCLATTYTFAPGLFDEQCLARFLEIESEPNREDLSFLLERESRLGSVYAGVLVDYTQAGVEHSLRWDVLPVRIRAGKQHAKLSLIVWSRHIRIIVASANLTEPGYRSNHEVAAVVDLTADDANLPVLADALGFLRSLIQLVPGASERPPEVRRAEAFLDQVAQHVRGWKAIHRGGTIHQQVMVTLPSTGAGISARSSLDDAVHACRGRSGSPVEAWVASPFFDADDDTSRVMAALCKLMARQRSRKLLLCVPVYHGEIGVTVSRLAAPAALFRTPPAYGAAVSVRMLPEQDADKNRRPWHAKMLALRGDEYSALMIGSSNFTCAGMGVGPRRNAEANLLTIVDRVSFGRQVGQIEAVWPEMVQVADPESAEWLGAQPDPMVDEMAKAPPLPAGFLSATYHAGDNRQIVLLLDPTDLPQDWSIHTCGRDAQDLLSASTWRDAGCEPTTAYPWSPVQPPEKLLVRWRLGETEDREAFMPLNVEDSRSLPPPEQLADMTADDMLLILAATDPSAAFRAWANQRQPADGFVPDLDSAEPIDLDPLRRYDLQATFLHRIRRRARVLAQLRSNLQRPVWGRQAIEWRLRGLIGVEQLADRLVRELASANGMADEALLTLADFLIVLREVDYQPDDGALPKPDFDELYRPFLGELADRLHLQVDTHRDGVSVDAMAFWERVVQRCRE